MSSVFKARLDFFQKLLRPSLKMNLCIPTFQKQQKIARVAAATFRFNGLFIFLKFIFIHYYYHFFLNFKIHKLKLNVNLSVDLFFALLAFSLINSWHVSFG